MTPQAPPQLTRGIFGIPVVLSFLISVIIVLRSKRRKLEDIWYLVFWFFGLLFWSFNTVGLLFWDYNFPVANIFMITAYGWIGFHIVAGLFYLLSKITNNKIAHSILGVFSLVFIVYYLSSWLPKLHLVQGPSYVYYNVSNFPFPGYVLSSFIIAMMAPIIYIIIKEFKTGEISLGNLSNFYALFAVIVYGGVAAPAVLYVNTFMFFLPFYLLIPYLIYLGYGKNKEKGK